MSSSDYFDEHEEQAFIAKALATAVAIILVRHFLSGLVGLLMLFFPFLFLFGLRMHAATSGVSASKLLKEHITLLPVMRSLEERRLEVKPWVTYGLILVNVLVFYGFEARVSEDLISDYLVFLPHRPDFFNVPLSAFTSLFLHAGNGHLWGNMTFLWVVGTAVERRVGSRKFLGLYLLTGLISNLVFLLVEFLFMARAGHILGASGAIAGIMGLFAVRCYFKTMIFPVPILGIFSLIFPVSLKIKLNSLMVMALFFLSDLSGGIGQIAGTSHSMVGHWAHLGGMISGMLLAGHLKLGDQAIEERHLVLGVKAAGETVGFAGGERSLQIVLERNPDNIEALLSLARLKTKYTPLEEGKELYEKVLRMMLTASSPEVPEVFREYRGKYHGVPQEPLFLARLAEVLRQANEHEMCIFCLTPLVEMEGMNRQVREKALFQLATLLEFEGCHEAAQWNFARFTAEYPDSVLAEKARDKAGKVAYRPPEAASARNEAAGGAACTCPACGASMTARTSRSGVHLGRRFWVCDTYPACRTTMLIEEQGEAVEHNPLELPPPPASYRLVFDGTIPFSSDAGKTRQNLGLLLNCGEEQVDRLLSGRVTVLKQGLSHAAAVRMKEAFDRTGACCSLEAEEMPVPVAPAAPPAVKPALSQAAAGEAPQLAAAESFHCPKCGQPQEKEECCIRCGVYFAKLALLAEREMDPLYAPSRARLAGT